MTVDGAILSYTSSSGNDGITASNTTWTSGKIDIGRLLQGFSAEGSNTVDLGAELGEGFSVLGLDTGQYRIEGSVLTIEDLSLIHIFTIRFPLKTESSKSLASSIFKEPSPATFTARLPVVPVPEER